MDLFREIVGSTDLFWVFQSHIYLAGVATAHAAVVGA
jgi:hypothetical protein